MKIKSREIFTGLEKGNLTPTVLTNLIKREIL